MAGHRPRRRSDRSCPGWAARLHHSGRGRGARADRLCDDGRAAPGWHTRLSEHCGHVLRSGRAAGCRAGAGLAVMALALVRMAATSRPRAWLAAAIGALVVVGLASPFALTRPDGLVANPPRDLYNAAYEAPPAGNLSGGQMSVPVTITNTGSQPWNTDGQERFRLGFHWLTPDARRLLGDGTEHALIGSLLPGETKVVDATVRA